MEEKRYCSHSLDSEGEEISKVTLRDHLLQHEFIGTKAQVEYGSSDNQKKINGRIIFETKNTVAIGDELKFSVIPKKSIARLQLVFGEETCFLTGSMIIGRPEDRLMKRW